MTTKKRRKCINCKRKKPMDERQFCSRPCRSIYEQAQALREKEKKRAKRKATRKKVAKGAVRGTKKAVSGGNKARKKVEKSASKMWGW